MLGIEPIFFLELARDTLFVPPYTFKVKGRKIVNTAESTRKSRRQNQLMSNVESTSLKEFCSFNAEDFQSKLPCKNNEKNCAPTIAVD